MHAAFSDRDPCHHLTACPLDPYFPATCGGMTGSQGIKSFFHRTKSPEPKDDSFIRSKLRRIVDAVPSIPVGKRRRHADVTRGRTTADRPCSPDGTRRNGRTQAWAVPAMQRGDDGRWQPPSLSRGSFSTSALAVYATGSEQQSPDDLAGVSTRRRNEALSNLFRDEVDPIAPSRGELEARYGLSESLPGQMARNRPAYQPDPVVYAAYRSPPQPTCLTEVHAATQPVPSARSKISFPDDMPGRALVRDRPPSRHSTPSLTSAETESTSPSTRPSTTFSAATMRYGGREVSRLEPVTRMSSPTLRIKARRMSEVLLDARHAAIVEVDDGEADLCNNDGRPLLNHQLSHRLSRPAACREEALLSSLASLEGARQTGLPLDARKPTYRPRPASRRAQSLDITERPAPRREQPARTLASGSPTPAAALVALRPVRLAEGLVHGTAASPNRRMTARLPPMGHADPQTSNRLCARSERADQLTADRPSCGQRHSSPASLVKPRALPQILEFRELDSTPVKYVRARPHQCEDSARSCLSNWAIVSVGASSAQCTARSTLGLAKWPPSSGSA